MKLLSLFIVFTMLSINWEPDFNTAKKTAAQEHKLILLNFSGSDWCGPCIATRRDYFESPGFTAMANENLVLVNADFPRKKKNMGSPQQIKRNEDIAEIYNNEGSFPLTLLLDAEGRVIKTWHGKPEKTPDEWTAEIKAICESRK